VFFIELIYERLSGLMKRVFISHSTNDREYVEHIIDLLEGIGVPSESIFCTSVEGYGIPLGDNSLERIRSELNEETVVLFILSNNFYNSTACLCEMGAVWVKTIFHIPILIPPFNFSCIKGLLPFSQGMEINHKGKLNSLNTKIREILNIRDFDSNRWERKRDRFICDINNLIFQDTEREVAACSTENTKICKNDPGRLSHMQNKGMRKANKRNISCKKDGKDLSESEIFEIIIRDVREKLNKLPWIVRRGLYYHFCCREFKLENGEDLKGYAIEAFEDDYIIIDSGRVILNLGDPLVKKAAQSLNRLKFFLENSSEAFHHEFEHTNEMCAKIESRKFWKLMEFI
jgi:hypothetical protein